MEEHILPHQHGEYGEHLIEHIPDTEKFQIVASIFKQLSDTTRIRIFWILCHCEECVINISALMDMSSPAVAHHLRLLKSSGLVETAEKEKKLIIKPVHQKKHSPFIT